MFAATIAGKENLVLSKQPSGDRNSKRRSLYDYSRSSGSGSHWYSSGRVDPLSHIEDIRARTRTSKVRQSTDDASAPRPRRQSRARERVERRRSGQPGNWAWMVIAGTLVGMTLITAMLLIFVARDNDNSSSTNSLAPVEPTSAIYDEGGALEGNSMVIEPWDGDERFTVLVMGLDSRPDEIGMCRTDTIMVISIDPVTSRISILSIPRDTYVEIPEFGLRPINQACLIGNLDSNSGPQLTMQTIQYNFGIRVHDYVLVNFNAFISIIDRIGGIDVVVEQEINDREYPDMFYGFDPFFLAAGDQHLDGETALKYARSRHTTDDIDRGRRQQQIIFAARSKVLSLNMVDDLIAQAVPIWNDLSDGVETSLSLDDMIRLALYAKDIPGENILNRVVDWDYLVPYQLEDGTSVVIPDRSKLTPLMLEIFGEGYND